MFWGLFYIASFLLNFSAENERIVLDIKNGRSCKLIIKEVEMQDQGEWKFFIETKQGQNKTMKKYFHNVAMRHNGKSPVQLNCYCNIFEHFILNY